MPNISVFDDIFTTTSEENFPLELYLQSVQNGKYEDMVHLIRKQRSEKQKDLLKQKIPKVTFSGIFSHRSDTGLVEHSGKLAMDLDDLEDPENVKKLLSQDRFVYACFRSTGGNGLTVLYNIKPTKHRESFLGIAKYLLITYGQLADPSGISLSKPYGFTFDPHIYIAKGNVPIWTSYPVERKVESIPNFAFAKDDFSDLLNQIVNRGIVLCQSYDEWLKVGFGLADKFGESGRQYFHMISSVHPKYNVKRTDDQYKYCIQSKNLKQATIKTFYFYCKEAGLQITSQRTSIIRKRTLNSKAAGLKKETIVKNLKEFEGITDCDEIVSEIFDGKAEIGDGESMIEQLEMFISANYNMERNELTRYLERDGKDISQRDMNSIYIAAKKILPFLNYDLVERLLVSDFIKQYNPIIRYFERLPTVKTKYEDGFKSPLIDKLASTIINDIQPFTEYFLRKWLVSIVSSAHGEHSPLMFVLLGEKQGKGKTEWFRKLPPIPLKRYYAESKLDAGKDDEILMTQKLIIMDDEMSGKSKREIQRLKELTSKQMFSLREPYGRVNVDLMRLAVLCGTSNFKEVLHDPTGNRRIIPIPVDDIDQKLYNSIDKEKLFGEIYCLWKAGFEWRILGDDIEYLRKYETDFEAANLERELLQRYFTPYEEEYVTSSDIKVDLEKLTQQRLSLDMIGKQLNRLGFAKKSMRIDGQSVKRWCIKRINRGSDRGGFTPITKDDF